MIDFIIRHEQSGLEIHSRGKTLAIDIGTMTPADTVKAMAAPDAILVSHKHSDHLGLDHLKALGSPIVAPGDVLELLHDSASATAIRAGQTLDVAGFAVTAVEADHGPKLSAPIENFGFIIKFPAGGHTLYFAGDIARPGTPPAGKFDIVVLPVGGAGFVFDPAEAVAYLEQIGHRGRVIPVHNSGPCDPDAIARFADLAPAHFEVITLAPGEKVEVRA
jgi:L-ascorbate metabolism protein UlaG (beta-lactamase superfamily)